LNNRFGPPLPPVPGGEGKGKKKGGRGRQDIPNPVGPSPFGFLLELDLNKIYPTCTDLDDGHLPSTRKKNRGGEKKKKKKKGGPTTVTLPYGETVTLPPSAQRKKKEEGRRINHTPPWTSFHQPQTRFLSLPVRYGEGSKR